MAALRNASTVKADVDTAISKTVACVNVIFSPAKIVAVTLGKLNMLLYIFWLKYCLQLQGRFKKMGG
jgi:hypothetical protein